jgi:hypothetical protein
MGNNAVLVDVSHRPARQSSPHFSLLLPLLGGIACFSLFLHGSAQAPPLVS